MHFLYMVFVYILAAMTCHELAVLLAENRVTGEMAVNWVSLCMLMTRLSRSPHKEAPSFTWLDQTYISLRCTRVYNYEMSQCHSIFSMEDSCRGTWRICLCTCCTIDECGRAWVTSLHNIQVRHMTCNIKTGEGSSNTHTHINPDIYIYMNILVLDIDFLYFLNHKNSENAANPKIQPFLEKKT